MLQEVKKVVLNKICLFKEIVDRGETVRHVSGSLFYLFNQLYDGLAVLNFYILVPELLF